MDISFRNGKLQKELCTAKKLQRAHGARQAMLIQRRLTEIEAARTLSVLRCLPGPRCHELKGERKGQFSVDLVHPYRLLFVPNHRPVPTKDAGGIDLAKVTAVKILGIEDTHE